MMMFESEATHEDADLEREAGTLGYRTTTLRL